MTTQLIIITYIEYTKEQFIEVLLKERKIYAEMYYEKYLQNPEEYLRNTVNQAHKTYISEIFPKIMQMTGLELYEKEMERRRPGDIGPNGEVISYKGYLIDVEEKHNEKCTKCATA